MNYIIKNANKNDINNLITFNLNTLLINEISDEEKGK